MEFTTSHAISVIVEISRIMNENKKLLADLDSQIGDGDLGITMTKAFQAAESEAVKIPDEEPGKFFIKIGMTIAKAAPSTMGTLIATGFMRGGKAVSDKRTLSIQDISKFLKSFTDGIQQRGKAVLGEKTILDVLYPACKAFESYKGSSPGKGFLEAEKAASIALEKTKTMISQHGKAAVFREATIGIQDPGGTAGYFIIKGFQNVLQS